MPLPDDFLDGIRHLGEGVLSTDPADLATYGRDWTKVYEPAPGAIAFPRGTADVATILRAASAARVAVVP